MWAQMIGSAEGLESEGSSRFRRLVSFVCLVGCFRSPTVVVNVWSIATSRSFEIPVVSH